MVDMVDSYRDKQLRRTPHGGLCFDMVESKELRVWFVSLSSIFQRCSSNERPQLDLWQGAKKKECHTTLFSTPVLSLFSRITCTRYEARIN